MKSKPLSLILLAGVLLVGCATPSTVQTRKAERPAAYDALPPEQRSLVDQGQIQRGMDTNAVYLAWGAPGVITAGENDSGQATTWTYYNFYVQTANIWGWRRVYYTSYPINYISAQVIFTNGLVRQWQTYPSPGY